MTSTYVPSGIFSFVLGFSGTPLVPRLVLTETRAFLTKVYIRQADAWTSLISSEAFLKREVLTRTPVVLICKEDSNTAISREIIYSIPQSRPWGLLIRCGNPKCSSLPGSMRISGTRQQQAKNHPAFKIACRQCQWQSVWVQRPDWVHELGQDFFFWLEFPLPEEKQHYFILKSLEEREALIAGDTMEE